jgi:hypothetical protein
MTFEPEKRFTEATDQDVMPDAVPEPPRSFTHVTSVTDVVVSEALPPNGIVGEPVAYVAAAVGVVMVTTGSSLSKVTVRTSVLVLPAPSSAVTVITLTPASSVTDGTDQEVVPVAVPDPPRSLTHLTSATEVIVSEEVPDKAMVEAVVW